MKSQAPIKWKDGHLIAKISDDKKVRNHPRSEIRQLAGSFVQIPIFANGRRKTSQESKKRDFPSTIIVDNGEFATVIPFSFIEQTSKKAVQLFG